MTPLFFFCFFTLLYNIPSRLSKPAPTRLCHSPLLRDFDVRGSPTFCPQLAFLRDFHASTNGTSEWNTSNFDVCNTSAWDGIACDDMGNRSVTRIQLSLLDRNHSGTLPTTIGHLASVEVVDLSGCGLFGPVPESIWKLERLTSLILTNNSFTGRLPATISSATNLKTVDLSDNNFTGWIPSQVRKMKKLSTVRLSRNSFSGRIPEGDIIEAGIRELSLTQNRWEDLFLLFELLYGRPWKVCLASYAHNLMLFMPSLICHPPAGLRAILL